MASGGLNIFVYDTIGPHLDVLIFESEARALAAFEEGARRIEAAARANAPWEDRTGDARAGLTAEVYDEGGDLIIELYHTVDYGIWLELIQEGRFATIMPTIEAIGPEVLREAGAGSLGMSIH